MVAPATDPAPAPRTEPVARADDGATVPPTPAAAPVATMPTPLGPQRPVAPAAAAAPSPPAPRTVSITAVRYLHPPVLDYPLAARRAREEGRVHVRVLVDPLGRPAQAAVVRSSGHERLDASALAAAQSTRFHPHAENGVALPFWVVMPLVFELEN